MCPQIRQYETYYEVTVALLRAVRVDVNTGGISMSCIAQKDGVDANVEHAWLDTTK
jgi:hypothetical protein